MKNEEIKDFDNNPVLRQLLIEYCLMQYEENSVTDDEHLLMEYNLLVKDNKLKDLFECEKINNSSKNGSHYRSCIEQKNDLK
jgi:hypothetical protein